ncbi:unnamed protein product [Ascophyllum nodosum]
MWPPRSYRHPLAALGVLGLCAIIAYALLTWTDGDSLRFEQGPDRLQTGATVSTSDLDRPLLKGAENTSLLQALYHLAREDVLETLSNGAKTCDNWRKTPDQRCTHAADCGKGWLFREKQLLLVMPDLHVDEWSAAEGSPAGDWYAGEARLIKVIGLREEGDGEEADCNAEDLSILLRMQGPEALAEAAVPVAGRCAWTAKFRPLLDGTYTVDATLVNWRAALEPNRSRCNEVPGAYPLEGSVKMKGGVPSYGGPFYSTHEGCCTLCTRAKGCVAWSATGNPSKALYDGDRCVLFSSVAGEPVEDDNLKGILRSGTSRGEEAMAFLSPSMSIGRSWCAERNTQVLGSGGQFSVTKTGTASSKDGQDRNNLPLCRSNLLHEGRWVSLADTSCDLGSVGLSGDGWPVYDKDIFGLTMPEECFLKPRRDSVAKKDFVLAGDGYAWEPYDCRYDMISSEARWTCMEGANITRFLDLGDSLLSTSRLARVALWMPSKSEVWSTVWGNPHVGDGALEAGCAGYGAMYYGEERWPRSNDVKSNSASSDKKAFMTRYCGFNALWQAKGDEIRKLVDTFAPDVVLANWAVTHRLWHRSIKEFGAFAENLGKQLDAMAKSNAHKPRYMFWLSAPFIVSEREPHCVLERAANFNAVLRAVLEPRGWIEVDWMSMTRKWAFDINDGMHHGQPPARMMAYMLMHHICHGEE